MLAQAVGDLKDLVSSLAAKVDTQGSNSVENKTLLRNLEAQVERLERIVSIGNGQPSITHKLAAMETTQRSNTTRLEGLEAKLESYSSAALLSRGHILVGVIGLLGTFVVAAGALVGVLIKGS